MPKFISSNVSMLLVLRRRVGWFLDGNLSPRRLANAALAMTEYAAGRDKLMSMPPILKIDISPACNLRCVSCLHADKRFFDDSNEVMNDQYLSGKQQMSVERYKQIIDQVRGKSSAVSLYYYGDPLVHRDLDEICRITADAGLNSHISTNFSFKLSDERIESIVRSGLTHLTVCVDGLSQENYGQTRVGGRIAWVLDNLERLCKARERLKQTFPRVEVQYIKFQHNLHEFEEAQRRFKELGVDQVTTFWGNLHNPTATASETAEIYGSLPDKTFPRCMWPWTYMLVKFNGDVIPCCNHRVTSQYRKSEDVDPRILGNVFETSVKEVWNDARYRAARRLAAKPSRLKGEADLEKSFCYACPALFDTSKMVGARSASEHAITDVHPQLLTLRKRSVATPAPGDG